MAIVICSNGHYYDDEKFKECPHCAAGDKEEDSLTVAMAHQSRQVENYAVEYIKKAAPNARIHVEAGRPDPDAEKTVGVYARRGLLTCTAGWLVCVRGAEYGRDFPLYAGFNRIGRGAGSDVALNDMQVSRDEHCSVIYEEKKNVFYLVPKAGSLTYVGEELVDAARELKSGQIVAVGKTWLELVAYCAGEKRWEKNT